MNNKITFPELIDRIAELTNTSKRVSESFLKELFGVIKERLELGYSVKIKNLGTFKVTEIAARKSVNVNTGEEMEIPSHRRVSFTPDKSLAEAINAPFEGFETVILDDDVSDADLQELSAIESPEVEEKVAAEIVEINEEITPPSFNEEVVQKETEDKEPENESKEEEPQAEENIKVEEDDNAISDDVETATTSISTYGYDDDAEEYEEVKTEKRKSFMWGFFGGILACILIGVIAIGVCDSCFGDFVPYSKMEQKITDTDSIAIKAVDSISQKTDTVLRIKEKEPAVAITDTVRTNYYLTKMSRKYYGRYEFWVYIYMENKDKISNPNKVAPGLVVVIPSPEKYGIDKNSEESVQKAKELAEKIL